MARLAHPRRFSALFDMPEAMWPYVPEFQYWLYDLSDYPDEEIKGPELLRMGLLALKHIFQDNLPEKIKDILALWQQMEKEPESLNFLLVLLRYLAGGSDKVSATELNEILEKVYPKGEDIMPTILQEAKAEGKAEGIIEGIRRSLCRLIARLFGVGLDHFDEELQGLDLVELESLHEMIFEVESLAELEALLISLRPVVEDAENSNL